MIAKFSWVSEIYVYICEDYIKNKPESAKDTMEKILFLMQYDSLQENKRRPMIPYKIYIDGSNVRVRYISDLLRVARAMDGFFVDVGSYYPYWWIKDQFKYMELSKRYKNLTANQIALKTQRIIENEELNSKYFVFGKYENKWMRGWARILTRRIGHSIKFFFWGLMSFSIMALIAITIISVMVFNSMIVVDDNFVPRVIYTYIGVLVFCGFWLIWTWKWTRPTEYEIEMKAKEEKERLKQKRVK